MAKSVSPRRTVSVMLKPGVWVRQLPDGQNLCKVMHCYASPASLEPFHRGLCFKHFESRADGRKRCIQCKANWTVEPESDGLCHVCHPRFQETTPFEAHFLEQIREGKAPVAAMQSALGGKVSDATARRAVEKLTSTKRMQRMFTHAFKEASGGVHPMTKAATKIYEAMGATKPVFNKEGEKVDDVPDFKASLQATDMAIKVMGGYPSRFAADKETPRQTNIAVAMLPQVEPRKPDAKIYTLPPRKKTAGDEE